MKRYTQKINEKDSLALSEVNIQDGYITGDAIERLAKFESFYDEIIKNQAEISTQLDELRSDGKEKTVQFRELFTKKLVNNNVIAFLRFHGLADKK